MYKRPRKPESFLVWCMWLTLAHVAGFVIVFVFYWAVKFLMLGANYVYSVLH